MTSAESPLPSPERAGAPGSQRVELSLPAQPELLFLARMTAAAVASRAEFGFDQVEDLRLAIDELCITLAGEDGSDGQVHLTFEWNADAVEVIGTLVPESDGSGTAGTAKSLPTLNELSERILDALVDEHGADGVGGTPRAWIRVRRHGKAGS
jgi:hypothetical protein